MGTTQQAACEKQAGFTLVELAIVMIIIGLLIGGVLKGQELIGNAQVTSTIAQLKATDAATTTFRDIYNNLPGDFPGLNRLPGCTAAPACANGNQDGVIGTVAVPINPGAAVVVGEQTGFFGHMVAANLISGAGILTAGAVNPGDEVPEATIAGASMRVGFVGAQPTGTAAGVGGLVATWRNGHYVAVAGNPVTAVGAAATSGLTPTQAMRIDSKLDDGAPNTGNVRAGGAATCVLAGPPVVYNTANVNADCASFVQIQS